MKKFANLAVGLSLSAVSTLASADIWEPGLGIRAQYVPEHEVSGSSGNTVDGTLFGAGIRYATASNVPISVGMSYLMGSSDHSGAPEYSSAEADTDILDIDIAVGRAFSAGTIELIPYLGLGFRQMEQDFSSDSYPDNNDIATPGRTHRHLYAPIGIYVGSASPIDRLDFFFSAEYRHVLMGESKLSRDGGTVLNSNDGGGMRAELGLQFPSTRSFNFFAGLYYEQFDIKAPDPGVIEIDGNLVQETEPKIDQASAGIMMGIQF